MHRSTHAEEYYTLVMFGVGCAVGRGARTAGSVALRSRGRTTNRPALQTAAGETGVHVKRVREELRRHLRDYKADCARLYGWRVLGPSELFPVTGCAAARHFIRPETMPRPISLSPSSPSFSSPLSLTQAE